MDTIDIEILTALQENGRITNSDLAKRVGLSAPSVLERVRKLEETGVVTGYTALIDPKKVARAQLCYVAISLSLHQTGSINEFRRKIETIPEVVDCFHITGEEDFLLRVLVRDMRHYENLLLNHLTKIPGASKIKTMVVLSAIKRSPGIHLDPSELARERAPRGRRSNRSSSGKKERR